MARVTQTLSSAAGTRTQFSGHIRPGDPFNPYFRKTSPQSSCWPLVREGTIGNQRSEPRNLEFCPESSPVEVDFEGERD